MARTYQPDGSRPRLTRGLAASLVTAWGFAGICLVSFLVFLVEYFALHNPVAHEFLIYFGFGTLGCTVAQTLVVVLVIGRHHPSAWHLGPSGVVAALHGANYLVHSLILGQ